MNEQTQDQGSVRPPTKRQIAEKAIEEICISKGISPHDIGMALSEATQKNVDLIKAERNMYAAEMDRMNMRVQYKELMARELTATKTIDNHQQEIQGIENDIKKTLLGWLNENASPEVKTLLSKIEGEFKLPYDEIKKDVKDSIDLKATQAIKNFIFGFRNASKKGKKELIAEYLK